MRQSNKFALQRDAVLKWPQASYIRLYTPCECTTTKKGQDFVLIHHLLRYSTWNDQLDVLRGSHFPLGFSHFLRKVIA